MGKENKPDAYQYLYATIQAASWISDAYKKFAEKYKETKKPLQELYLCFCERVPLDILQMAELSEPVENSFRSARRKHIESELLKNYSSELEQLKAITAETENEIKQMSSTVNIIAEAIPTFDELFMAPMDIEETKEVSNVLQNEKMSDAPKDVKKHDGLISGTSEGQLVNTKEKTVNKDNWIKKVTKKLTNLLRLRNNPTSMVVNMISEGYSEQQINFILSCIEEGMSESDIQSFSDPRIPIEVMKKLKELKEKENLKHGK